MEERRKPFFRFPGSYAVFGVTVLVAVFYVGFTAGTLHGARSVVPDGEARVVNTGRGTDTEDIDFQEFWDVWNLVKDTYIDQPVSEQDLFYGALHGIVSGLNDQYSVFFSPEEATTFNNELNGTFSGIGAEIDSRDDYIIVVAPLANTPAAQAGLLSGDRIAEIDGVDTYGMSVQDAVLAIRGEKGSTVVLTIVRDGVDESLSVPIVRDDIRTDSVTWEIREDGIGVVQLYMFNDDTTGLFDEAVQDMLAADVDGIVLDLRNNPGGLLTAAINVAGYWIDGKPVVAERTLQGTTELSASGVARLAGIPTVVLINGGSASASEILAGALRDHEAATLIGETTFGKGTVQEYIELEDGSAVKITVSEWLTPNHDSINNVGIAPDIEVAYTIDDYHEGRTPQFDAAIDFLKK